MNSTLLEKTTEQPEEFRRRLEVISPQELAFQYAKVSSQKASRQRKQRSSVRESENLPEKIKMEIDRINQLYFPCSTSTHPNKNLFHAMTTISPITKNQSALTSLRMTIFDEKEKE